MERSKSLLRFLTCGNVDDGKSTLIGRLLYDSGQIPDDQLATLRAESAKAATVPDSIDYSLLVDGLLAEREQSITIDVAYRYFSSPKRAFIVADTPGHEQYTRNMATGASVSDAAVMLLDAKKGILRQTRRHTTILGLLGIRDVILAVNKMDLVEWNAAEFDRLVEGYREFASKLGVVRVVPIPVAAPSGDNIVHRSANTPWYHGPTLLGALEEIDVTPVTDPAFHMPVQRVNRPNAQFRGYSGTVGGGSVAVGDEVVILPSNRTTRIKEIIVGDKTSATCGQGDAVMLALADDVDVARGDIVASRQFDATIADQIEATIIWMNERPLLPGRSYLLKCATATVSATVSQLKSIVSVDTLEETAGRSLELNDIGHCDVTVSRPLVFRPYAANHTMGAFILIDKITNATVGAGIVNGALRRAGNIRWQALTLTKAVRAQMKMQSPRCIWFTGLPGAGKSTLANLLERRLADRGRHTYILDGDNVRHGLNRDLGFADAERVENIRRVAEVARLMVDAGLMVIVSLISPARVDRLMARELFEPGEFIEVFVNTSLEDCEARDPKGLYRKARQGLVANFTGISAPYEIPESPEIVVSGIGLSPNAEVERIAAYLCTGKIS